MLAKGKNLWHMTEPAEKNQEDLLKTPGELYVSGEMKMEKSAINHCVIAQEYRRYSVIMNVGTTPGGIHRYIPQLWTQFSGIYRWTRLWIAG